MHNNNLFKAINSGARRDRDHHAFASLEQKRSHIQKTIHNLVSAWGQLEDAEDLRNRGDMILRHFKEMWILAQDLTEYLSPMQNYRLR